MDGFLIVLRDPRLLFRCLRLPLATHWWLRKQEVVKVVESKPQVDPEPVVPKVKKDSGEIRLGKN